MIRTGEVVSTSTHVVAQVQLDDSACARCEKGQGCAIRLFQTKKVNPIIDTHNWAEAEVGDRVEVTLDISTQQKLRVYGVYLFPLMGLVFGTLAGTMLSMLLQMESQLLPSIAAVVGFAMGLYRRPSYNCDMHDADLQPLNPRITRLLAGKKPTAVQPKRIQVTR